MSFISYTASGCWPQFLKLLQAFSKWNNLFFNVFKLLRDCRSRSLSSSFSKLVLDWWPVLNSYLSLVEPSWNVMAHGDARAGKWRGNWRMEWVASTLYTTSEHGVSSITTADAHTSAASSRLNWRPCRFKLTCPFRGKKKSGFCACAITFQTQSTELYNFVLALSFKVISGIWHVNFCCVLFVQHLTV